MQELEIPSHPLLLALRNTFGLFTVEVYTVNMFNLCYAHSFDIFFI